MKFSEGKPYKVIALCMAKFDNLDQVEIMNELYKVCKENNYRIQVFTTLIEFTDERGDDESELQIFELMDPAKYDGVVILSSLFKRIGIATYLAEKVISAGVPCVSINEEIEGCINVCYDFTDSFEEIVRHIVEFHKCKRVNFIAGQKSDAHSNNRMAIYKKVLEENGIPIEEDRIDYGDYWEIPTERVVKNFLASGKPIDAIICANDFMAMEACRQLRLAGKRVPEDIIVSGFDGVEIEKYHYPRLVTAQSDVAGLAKRVIELIDEYNNGYEVTETVSIGCKFRVGQSCGCHSLHFSDEELVRLGSANFNTSRYEKTLKSRISFLYEGLSEQGSSESLADLWHSMTYFVLESIGCAFQLMINDDFIGENLDIFPDVKPLGESSYTHYYTDELRVAMNYEDFTFNNGQVINKNDLILDKDRIFDKNVMMIFLPVYVQRSTVGYAMATVDRPDFEYFMLYAYIMNLRHVIDMRKFRIDMQNLYSTDLLTNLLNRKGFTLHMKADIEQAIKDKTEMGLISIDMNWLKMINDNYGHKEGDFALAKIGYILKDAVADIGVCTRFGGDEFSIAFTGEDCNSLAENILKTIDDNLERFNKSKIKPYPLTISRGYFVHVPDENEYHLERFILEADRRMYKDKENFKATHNWEGKQGL